MNTSNLPSYARAVVDADVIDEEAVHGNQRGRYKLTIAYRVTAPDGATYTIRCRIDRDTSQFQSSAIVDVLTPALTWTTLAMHSPRQWWPGTPETPTDSNDILAALLPAAYDMACRATRILGL